MTAAGPRECSDPQHRHVLMCPVQASAVASLAVMAGMARREDNIGNVWWGLGLNQLRYADAEEAVRWLVGGGIGDRSWITARDVIRRARSVRAARQEQAPPPVPPAGLEDEPGLPAVEAARRFKARQDFTRWYWTAVGNGEAPGRALELAAGTVGADRYIEARAPEGDGPVSSESIDRVRAIVAASRNRSGR